MTKVIINTATALLCAVATLFVCPPTVEAQTASEIQIPNLSQEDALKLVQQEFQGTEEVIVYSNTLINVIYLVIYSINSEIIDEKKLSLQN